MMMIMMYIILKLPHFGEIVFVSVYSALKY